MQTIPYLVPRQFFPSPRLDGVLLLVPSYIRPDLRTHMCIDQCIQCGAEIVASFGCSDIALHRCIVAGRAYAQIQRNPGKYTYVVWIDDDMTFGPPHLAFMREQCRQMQTAVTGLYCKRGNPNVLCIRAITEMDPPIEPRRVILASLPDGSDASAVVFDSYPVTSGMGCLMLSVEHFVKHCEAVPQIRATSTDGSVVMTPGICAAGMCDDRDGTLGWVSEDQDYTENLWARDIGLWTCPIVFGHVSELPLFPVKLASWLSDKQPEVQTIPSPPIALDGTPQDP